MAVALWPAGLPLDVDRAGYGESPPDVTLRTPMDAGPAKTRKRVTADVRPLRVRQTLTRTQVETLDAFYLLVGGHSRWEWRHPRTLATVQFRFVSRPEYGEPGSEAEWPVTLSLEIMP